MGEQRLIDANALKKVVEIKKYDVVNEDWREPDGFSAGAVFDMIDDQPTVDPVKHAHWVKWSYIVPTKYMGKHYCSCSNCGGRAPYDERWRERKPEWCPGCGCHMWEEVGLDEAETD